MKNLLFSMLGMVVWSHFGLAQAGSIDSAFGNGGVIYCETNYGDYDNPKSIMDEQGRIYTLSDLVDDPGFLVVRCLSNGSLDASFGSHGHAFCNPGALVHPEFLQLLKNGEMLVTGSIMPLPGDSSYQFDFFMVRLHPDGLIDSAFGQNGLLRVDLKDGMYVQGMALQQDGKIVVSGLTGRFLWGPGNTDVVMMRILPGGQLDYTFGKDGIVITDLPSLAGDIDSGGPIAIQPDGKIVVAGKNGQGYNSLGYVAIMRFESNGMLDTSFANKGSSIDTLSYIPFSHDIVITANLSILVSGQEGDVFGGGIFYTLRQYTPEGYLDTAFADNGIYVSTRNLNGKSLEAIAKFDCFHIGNINFKFKAYEKSILHSVFDFYNYDELWSMDINIFV